MSLLDPEIAAGTLGCEPLPEVIARWGALRAAERFPDAGKAAQDVAGAFVAALASDRRLEDTSDARPAVAARVMQAFLGAAATRDPDAEHTSPEEIHRRAVDLAIELICDEEHTVAEITAGAASWLLYAYSGTRKGSWAGARARRMCDVVGVRFPRDVGPPPERGASGSTGVG